ncbi:MAG: cytochrome c oxidase subunit 3 [Gammaproteobacteria bacterium]|nr:cytochrome c oxidase subunit 3 [Gammaproteobacteria bacterium]
MKLFRSVTNKPWERKGIIGGMRPEGAFNTDAERVALSFFLIIASVVFSLFTVSYFIRMELPDWQPLAEPTQLWLNTGLLVASSVLFQWARNIVGSGQSNNLLIALVGAGVFALLFIVGQLLTWQDLQAAGLYLSSNPANAFYYLMTGLHAVHLLGGLWVWSRSTIRLLSGAEVTDIKLSIELCALYWHFLLLVWLVLFALLANT